MAASKSSVRIQRGRDTERILLGNSCRTPAYASKKRSQTNVESYPISYHYHHIDRITQSFQLQKNFEFRAMSAESCSSGKYYEPTQDEDNKLYLGTGFRYFPAFERGYPFPWCAKRKGKGWIVRDSPPPPPLSKQPDVGAQFLGWKEANKMFRSREILIQRAHKSRKKAIIPSECNSSEPADDRINQLSNVAKVDHWFRHTHSAVKIQQREAVEAEFQTFLKKKRKQYALQIKEEQRNQRKKKREQKDKKGNTVDGDKTEEPSAVISNQTSDASSLMLSPTKRKHKQMTPKRNPNSVTLGEDPDLDDMIEDIVLEFTHEYTNHGQGNTGKTGGVNFDGSAVSALREAARETLLQQGIPSALGRGTNNCATSTANAAGNIISDSVSEHRKQDGDDSDVRITGMIEQLIGEVEQDSGCQFDGPALQALKEAAKEMDSSNLTHC